MSIELHPRMMTASAARKLELEMRLARARAWLNCPKMKRELLNLFKCERDTKTEVDQGEEVTSCGWAGCKCMSRSTFLKYQYDDSFKSESTN